MGVDLEVRGLRNQKRFQRWDKGKEGGWKRMTGIHRSVLLSLLGKTGQTN